jgi:hypothetical protein
MVVNKMLDRDHDRKWQRASDTDQKWGDKLSMLNPTRTRLPRFWKIWCRPNFSAALHFEPTAALMPNRNSVGRGGMVGSYFFLDIAFAC